MLVLGRSVVVVDVGLELLVGVSIIWGMVAAVITRLGLFVGSATAGRGSFGLEIGTPPVPHEIMRGMMSSGRSVNPLLPRRFTGRFIQ